MEYFIRYYDERRERGRYYEERRREDRYYEERERYDTRYPAPPPPSYGKRPRARSPSPKILSPYDDGIHGTPVGTLQEVCMSRRWPPPVYELSHEEGLPHERMFTIHCVIEVGIKKQIDILTTEFPY